MRKLRTIFALLVLLVIAMPVFADFDPAYSDYLFYNKGDLKGDMAYLEEALSYAKTDAEKAAIIWRLSRTQLTITDDFVDPNDKALRLAEYQKSWDLALESIGIMETADGYHWLASAMGRWGQTKGPLNALGKADEMRSYLCKVQDDFKADMSDSWYVLSVLYSSVPGGISFGNNNYAISYMRRCVDTQDNINRLNLTNYLELSNQLYDRNWDAKKRAKEFDKMQKNYQKNTLPSEKMKYYEGKDGSKGQPFYSSVPYNQFSDRQEAVMLLIYAEAMYNMKQNPKASETEKYEKIHARLAEIY